MLADTNSAVSQTNGPPWACQAPSPIHLLSPPEASWSVGRRPRLRKLPRAASCCANPDVPEDGKRANEAAEDCTPPFVSPSPSHFLGHPAVRPDAPPEVASPPGGRPGTDVGPGASSGVGIKWAALGTASSFFLCFFSSLRGTIKVETGPVLLGVPPLGVSPLVSA